MAQTGYDFRVLLCKILVYGSVEEQIALEKMVFVETCIVNGCIDDITFL